MTEEQEQGGPLGSPEQAATSAMKRRISAVLRDAQRQLLLDLQGAARAVTECAPPGIVVSKEQYGYWARGQRLPPVYLVPAICLALNITPNILLGVGEEDKLLLDAEEAMLLKWFRATKTESLRRSTYDVARSNAAIDRRLQKAMPETEHDSKGSAEGPV